MAGLMAAAQAEALGVTPLLIDNGIQGAHQGLGGFAPFSGAKFSLFPAGRGLSPLVGGDGELIRRYAKICREFTQIGLSEFNVSDRQIAGQETEMAVGLAHRNYHSILLSPRRIDALLAALTRRLKRTRIIRARAKQIAIKTESRIIAVLESGEIVCGRSFIIAAGRLGGELLTMAGVTETHGKGIEIGVRFGFDTRSPVANLRKLGPDAKFMADGTRTFCLNSPGKIFHYPGLGFSLPGGIVAEADWPQSNVGILCRLPNRKVELERLLQFAPTGKLEAFSFNGSKTDLEWTAHAADLLGPDVVSRINSFIHTLVESGLIDLPSRYRVHYPLLDWHWPVFSLTDRLATAAPRIFAAGDSSGHARGLMQAALTGELAVEEALS
ncbi:hypothetical protein M2323_004451 [Rhodoblastus acidophilus]|uniref:hypothetical protein n=1 Tax=Rhodoblastus acidophilus TaxID=1074 RepID=UPI002224BF67|nr:hypothetical protein [Rhodoblastus acidophilus]MCW2286682.1 hypothetical protein [Rhodoblastus acidophilus]MCW2335502.1 hypothetical protein [Rhodoblastus acidophilus]